MTREGSQRDSFVGQSGLLAVLSELLVRLCNVALREVDEGEDALVFASGYPEVARLQVKMAVAEPLKEPGRFAARVSVPLAQLLAPMDVELYYTFAVRLGDRWQEFIVLPRSRLRILHQRGAGYVNRRSGEVQLYLSFGPDSVTCSKQDWQEYRAAWHLLPLVQMKAQE